MSVEHLIVKNGAAVKGPKRLGSQPKSGRSMQPIAGTWPKVKMVKGKLLALCPDSADSNHVGAHAQQASKSISRAVAPSQRERRQ
jgi:hypothetical protein